MTLSDLDTLTATVGQMTPGDVTACKSSLGGTLGLAEDTPATIRKYSTDEQGRRVTQFIAELHGARLPNDANAEGFAALKNAAPALLHAARTLENIRKLRDSFAVYVQSQFPSGEDQNPPCASFSSDTSDDDMCKHCGWVEQSHYDYAILSELLALLDAAPAQET